MAVSMVIDPEFEQELAESHLMLKNDCLCFRMPSSIWKVALYDIIDDIISL